MTVIQAPETVIPAGTWTIDPSHSSLEFGVKHLGIATVKGRASGFAGSIVGGEAAAIEGTVPVSTLTTFDETRDGHLQSPEFFDSERHPELRFVSTSVERDGGELVVAGDLTIKGITRPVELRGDFAGTTTDPGATSASASTSLARSIGPRSTYAGTRRSPAADYCWRTTCGSRPASRR